jgi:nickel superoxide dismutase
MIKLLLKVLKPEVADAHCDAPCGVYDGASAEIAARAALNLTKKILELKRPESEADRLAYEHTLIRYTAIKEEQTDIAKREILILWTDYFKPEHLTAHPNLHETVWKLTKLCSTVKRTVDLEAATKLHEDVMKLGQIHHDLEHAH